MDDLVMDHHLSADHRVEFPPPRPVRSRRVKWWWLPYAVVAAAWVVAVAAVVFAQYRR